MKTICVYISALLLSVLSSAQPMSSGDNPLDAIPSSFRYKSHFKDFAFLPGKTPLLISRFETSNADYKAFVKYIQDSLDEKDVSRLLYKLPGGEEVNIYPDTLVWIKDFAYTVNEPFTRHYFNSAVFAGYPVVGISQKQAMAYCHWKTRLWNKALAATGDKSHLFWVSLPTKAQWESAALEKIPFTVFDRTQMAGYQNSFRIKDYADDGAFFLAPCNAYKPNSKGIFNLCGNVAEWTLSSPDDGAKQDSVIVKGGSWCSGAFYLQPAIDQCFASGETHCYIGFRIVLQVIQNNL